MLRSVANASFCLLLLGHCTGAAIMMKLVHLFFPISKKAKENLSLRIVKVWWGLLFMWSPWIKVIKEPGIDEAFDAMKQLLDKSEEDVKSGKSKTFQPLMLLGNHSTFLDVPLSVAMFPHWLTARSRTYMGAFLYKLPIMGTICHCVGHFPVYFKSTELNSFKVDTDKMAVVEQGVDDHLADSSLGGIMGFYPEGQVNKYDPDKIMDFRFGGMKRALEFNARIGLFVFHGNPKVWPAKAQAAGYPGTIRVTVKFLAPEGCKDYVDKIRAKGLPEEEKELKDEAIMAKYMKKEMQELYDGLKAKSTKGAADKKQD